MKEILIPVIAGVTLVAVFFMIWPIVFFGICFLAVVGARKPRQGCYFIVTKPSGRHERCGRRARSIGRGVPLCKEHNAKL